MEQRLIIGTNDLKTLQNLTDLKFKNIRFEQENILCRAPKYLRTITNDMDRSPTYQPHFISSGLLIY